jgi:hypothetical protein
MLSDRPDLLVVAEASEGLEAVRKAEELQPDLADAPGSSIGLSPPRPASCPGDGCSRPCANTRAWITWPGPGRLFSLRGRLQNGSMVAITQAALNENLRVATVHRIAGPLPCRKQAIHDAEHPKRFR